MDSMGGGCGLERGTECVVGWEEGKGGRGEGGQVLHAGLIEQHSGATQEGAL